MGMPAKSGTSQVGPSMQGLSALNDVLPQVQQYLSPTTNPYTPVMLQTAEQNPTQAAAAGQYSAAYGAANTGLGTYGQASDLIQGAAQPLTQDEINQYFNPYVNQVVDATQRQFALQNAQQQNQVVGNEAAQGALGGNRTAVAGALTAGQQASAEDPIIAGMLQAGYTQQEAMAAQQYQQIPLAAASALQQIGSGQEAAAGNLGNLALGQFGLGTQQQQYNTGAPAGTLGASTAQDIALYQEQLARYGYPIQLTNMAAGDVSGISGAYGSTTTTTPPPPSLVSGLAGLGVFGLGAGSLYNAYQASDRRLKEDIKVIGKTKDGQTIYRFRFKGHPQWHIGLMAQDVEKKHPEAVRHISGYKAIDVKKATDAAARFAGGRVQGLQTGGVPAMPYGASPVSGLGPIPYAGGGSYIPQVGATNIARPSAAAPMAQPQDDSSNMFMNALKLSNLGSKGGLGDTVQDTLQDLTAGDDAFPVGTPGATGGRVPRAGGGGTDYDLDAAYADPAAAMQRAQSDPAYSDWLDRAMGVQPPGNTVTPPQGLNLQPLGSNAGQGSIGPDGRVHGMAYGGLALPSSNRINVPTRGGLGMPSSMVMRRDAGGSADMSDTSTSADTDVPPLNPMMANITYGLYGEAAPYGAQGMAEGGTPKDDIAPDDTVLVPDDAPPPEAPVQVAQGPAPAGVATDAPEIISTGVSRRAPEDPRGMVPFIRETAKKYGIDPNVAVNVARSEGLGTFTSGIPGEKSFGAFQLNTQGGMGNEFYRDTGLDPSDPRNEKATINYALSKASTGGWGPFHGAKNRYGYDNFAGINGNDGTQALALDEDTSGRSLGTRTPAGGIPGVTPIKASDLSGKTKPDKTDIALSIMAAGLGMMGSRSPYAGVGIGQGGLQGLGMYEALHKQRVGEAEHQAQLQMQADIANQRPEIQQQTFAQQRTLEAEKDRRARDLAAITDKRARDLALETEERQRNQPRVMTPGQELFDPKTGKVLHSNESGQMTDQAVDMAVDRLHAGDKAALQNVGRGAQSGVNLTRIQNRLAERAAAEGWTGADLAAAQANFSSQSAAARTAAVRSANVETAIEEARQTFPLAVEASKNLPRTSFVPFNKLEQMVREGTSSPEQIKYNTAIRGAITAYSQAMSRTGVNSVHAQQAAEELLNRATGHEGIVAAFDQMEKEMEAAKVAPDIVRKHILERISGRAETEPPKTTATATPEAKVRHYDAKGNPVP